MPQKKGMSPHHTSDMNMKTILLAVSCLQTRLAPLKAMSILRLELMGALMGLRLIRKICSAVQVPMNKATLWVDSANVGFWIQGKSRNYKPFVAHRVSEIHDGFSPEQWRHVPTKVNPADLKTLRTDNGGKFMSSEFQNFLKAEGVRH